jgi:hypothetical protein
LIEFEVKRATEDMIRSASASIWVGDLGIFCSTDLLISASPAEEGDFSAAAEDGAFIGFSVTGFGFVSCLTSNVFPVSLTNA